MNNSKCLFKYKGKSNDGLLFKIPFQGDDTSFLVVITALHPFKEMPVKNEEVEIIYKDGINFITVDLSRTFYSNDEYDIILIEIKEYDDLYLIMII